jgi:DNA-binding GntR family transcriptional regulator
MAITSIGELLDRAGQFEERLESYYAAIRDRSRDNGVRLLTYYLSRHRRHLQEALQSFTAEQIAHIRKIRLKYDIVFYPEKEFVLMETAPEEVHSQELLEAAVGYDLELVNLYKSILKQPIGPEGTQAVECLIRMEERDIVMIKKMIATHYF